MAPVPSVDPGEVARWDAVLDGLVPARDLSGQESDLAAALAALRAPACTAELAVPAVVMVAFTEYLGHPAARGTSGSGRRRLGRAATVGAVIAVGALSVTGAAAAAYTGALPATVQHLAHVVIGAPDTDQPGVLASPTTGVFVAASQAPSTPATPTATPRPIPTRQTLPPPAAGSVGHSNVGLCRAWSQTSAHPNPNSALVRSLARLAGGTGSGAITAYCATVLPTPITAAPVPTPPADQQTRPAAPALPPQSHATTPHTHPVPPVHAPSGSPGPPAGRPA